MHPDRVIHGITHVIGRSGLKTPPMGACYIDEDYPFGFRLRCRRAHWIEVASSGSHKGEYRHVTCTTNPKRGDRWNAPKASTYSEVMLLYVKGEHWDGDEPGRVGSATLDANCGAHGIEAFEAKWTGQLEDGVKESIKSLRKLTEYLNRPRAMTITTSKAVFDGSGLRQTEAPSTEFIPAKIVREESELWAYFNAGATPEVIAPEHRELFGHACKSAQRVADASGFRIVVAYRPYAFPYGAFPHGPLTNARLHAIMGRADDKPAPIVAIIDPTPADQQPEYDTTTHVAADEADNTPAPTGAGVGDGPITVVDDRPLPGSASTSGLDWVTIVPELDATAPFEREGRTVKMLELATEIERDEIPPSVVELSAYEAQERDLSILSDHYGLWLLRDLGPIPPDADDEPMPEDRADDDGMAPRIEPEPRTGTELARIVRGNSAIQPLFNTGLSGVPAVWLGVGSLPVRRRTVPLDPGARPIGRPTIGPSDPAGRPSLPSPRALLALPAPAPMALPVDLMAILDAPAPTPTRNRFTLGGGRVRISQPSFFDRARTQEGA